MNPKLLLLPLACALLPYVASGNSGGGYAYQTISVRSADGTYPGWAEGSYSSFMTTEVNLDAVENPVLICWDFGTHSPTSTALFPYCVPAGIYVSRGDYSDDWEMITVNPTGQTLIPAGYSRYGMNISGCQPDAITIGPQITSGEPVTIAGADVGVKIKTGTMTDRGIRAVGSSTQTAEVELTAPGMSALTQAYARMEYFVMTLVYESDGMPIQHNYPVSVSVTATTASGSNVDVTPIKPQFLSGELVTARYLLLPASTVSLNVRWTISDVEPYQVYNEAADRMEEVYPESFVRSDYTEVFLTEEPQTRFLTEISQRGAMETAPAKDLRPSLSRAAWYDIDGDGVKEWANGSLQKLNADFLGSMVINKDFGMVDGWVNYGADKIGAYWGKTAYSFNGTNTLTPLFEADETLAIIDFNNDGCNDFLAHQENRVYAWCGDAGFRRDRLDVMTPEEFYDYIKQRPSSGLGSGVSFVGNPIPPILPGSYTSYDRIDVNNDGYVDFIDAANGRALINTGHGSFVSEEFGGAVTFRDFDGDGITDKLIYDPDEKSITVYLQRRGSDAEKTQLFSGLNCGSSVWCHDFDADGDIDILVPFNGDENSGMSYLVMFENTGSGRFKRRENFIEDGRHFYACADWDSDGNFEALAMDFSSRQRNIYSYEINGLNVSTSPETIYSGARADISSREEGMLVADLDGSGLQRIILGDRILTPSSKANTAPARPSRPMVNYDAATGQVTISWNHSTDRESSPLDLTYELRIGSAPDRADIVWADALADGTRLNLLEGNCGYALQRRYDASSWPAGTVYVSVQAIDPAGMGSPFSEYATFQKSAPASAFISEAPDFIGINTECQLLLVAAPSASLTYDWNLGDGGTILSRYSNGAKASWATPGDKTVTLTVTDPAGNRSQSTRTLHVAPVKIDRAIEAQDIVLAFDLDLDGCTELVCTSSTPILEGDDECNYTPVKRIFNSNITGEMKHVADINRDGLPDLLSDRMMLINEGDNSMQVKQMDTYISPIPLVDLDNDGLYDRPDGRNTGDYINFTPFDDVYNRLAYADVNGDGLIDILAFSHDENELITYTNFGNFDFRETDRSKCPDLEVTSGSVRLVGDMDADGRPDLTWTKAGGGHGYSWYSDNLYVRYSDGQLLVIPAPSGHQFGVVEQVFDYDNNGCMDILLHADDNYYVAFLYPDRTYSLEKVGETYGFPRGSVPYLRPDGLTGLGSAALRGPANTAPAAPRNLRAVCGSESVVIEWDRATDAETPSQALRYNISVKHKGLEGEGAWFISPLNGGLDGVAVPSSAQLLTSNRITIPAQVIPAGEYEVKVQSVDTRWLQSPFSETITFKVEATAAVDMPTSTMVGQPTPVRLRAGFSASDLDFGPGASVETHPGNELTVTWSSEGLKEVKADGLSAQIYVYPALDASFTMPETVNVGSRVRLTADGTHPDDWSVKFGDRGFFQPISENKFVDLTVIDDHTVEVCFTYAFYYELRHTITETYGSDECIAKVNVVNGSNPEITCVDIDPASGCHRVNWAAPASAGVSAINVYRESIRSGEYDLTATLSPSETSWVDPESRPDVHSARYRISHTLPYGESAPSVAHQPIHVMANRGLGSNINLSWSRYEGLAIATYRILRGATPQTLRTIAEISGNLSSYSDTEATEAEPYYAVEISLAARSRSAVSTRSNVISSANAIAAVLATSIEIGSLSGEMAIDGTSGNGQLQLQAYVFPVHSTFTRVDWVITSGAEAASISADGLLTARADGNVTVRAYATDGSGAYGEATIPVSDMASIALPAAPGSTGPIKVSVSQSAITVTGLPADPVEVRLYDLDGIMRACVTSADGAAIIPATTLPRGVYLINAGGRSARFVR